MMEPVVEERIEWPVRTEHEACADGQQEPAERVARLAPGDNHAYGRGGAADHQPRPHVRAPARQEGQRHHGHGEQHERGACHARPRRRPGHAEAGRAFPRAHRPCSLTQTETCAGSRDRPTTSSRCARTAPRSTASFRRALHAATVTSASYRARLKRRSTTRCTRRRTGLNSAAAARVDAATATGDENDSSRVASRTSPAYTPTSNPVTIA